MSEKKSEKAEYAMSVEAEAIQIFCDLAGLEFPGVRKGKEHILRAASATGLAYGRVKRVWYGEARLWADEMDVIRKRAAKAREGRGHLGRRSENLEQRLAQVENRLDALLAERSRRVADEAGGYARQRG